MTPSSPYVKICRQDLSPLFVGIIFTRHTPSSKKKYIMSSAPGAPQLVKEMPKTCARYYGL